MPHAALCVSRPNALMHIDTPVIVSMPHAALCVSRLHIRESLMSVAAGFNAARSIVCVEIAKLGLLAEIVHSFNAARSIVCVETLNTPNTECRHLGFQCRTQHCVCRDIGSSAGSFEIS